MTTDNNNNGLEPLPMKRQVVTGLDISRYSIRAASGEVREIKANTAYEAFRSCGLDQASKIERLFALDKNIIEKSKLQEVKLPPDGQDAQADESMRSRLARRISSIISADELDEIMRAIQTEPAKPAALPAEKVPATVATMPPPLPVPEPAGIAAPEAASSPVGMDVHGDGFDEIIPAAPSTVKPQTAHKAIEHKEEMLPPAADPLPERELSSEEIEKLLSGKS